MALTRTQIIVISVVVAALVLAGVAAGVVIAVKKSESDASVITFTVPAGERLLTRAETNPTSPKKLYNGDIVGGAGFGLTNIYGSQELFVPVGDAFKAQYKFVQVRCDDTGTLKIADSNTDGPNGTTEPLNPTGGYLSARWVLMGYGNLVPDKMDNYGSETDPRFDFVLFNNRRSLSADVSGTRPRSVTIPGFNAGNSRGNGFLQPGKTYRFYAWIWDNVNDMFQVKWPEITVTQKENGQWQTVMVSGVEKPTSITSSEDTPCMITRHRAVRQANPSVSRVVSSDGKYEMFVEGTTGQFKIQNLITGETRNSRLPANSDGLVLCMMPSGNLEFTDLDGNLTVKTNAAKSTLGPFTLSLENTGTVFVKDAAGNVLWSDPENAPE